MNLKIASLIFSLIIIISCQKEVQPSYTLSEEQLIKLMADIHVSEAASVQLSVAIRDSMNEVYLEQILKIHQIEKSIFKEDFNQLRKDPKKLEKVYAKVISKLNEMKLNKNLKEDIENEQQRKKR